MLAALSLFWENENEVMCESGYEQRAIYCMTFTHTVYAYRHYFFFLVAGGDFLFFLLLLLFFDFNTLCLFHSHCTHTSFILCLAENCSSATLNVGRGHYSKHFPCVLWQEQKMFSFEFYLSLLFPSFFLWKQWSQIMRVKRNRMRERVLLNIFAHSAHTRTQYFIPSCWFSYSW